MQGPYKSGCSQFERLYTGAAQEMSAISNALSETAAEYKKTEDSGVQTAGQIND